MPLFSQYCLTLASHMAVKLGRQRRSDIALVDPSLVNTMVYLVLTGSTMKVDEHPAYVLQKYNTLSQFLALVPTRQLITTSHDDRLILNFQATITNTHRSGFYNCFSSGSSDARKCLKLISWSSVYIQVFLIACHYIGLFYSAQSQTPARIMKACAKHNSTQLNLETESAWVH